MDGCDASLGDLHREKLLGRAVAGDIAVFATAVGCEHSQQVIYIHAAIAVEVPARVEG